MKRLLDKLEDQILIVDRSGMVLFANSALLRYIKQDLSTLEGKYYRDILSFPMIANENILNQIVKSGINNKIQFLGKNPFILEVIEDRWDGQECYIIYVKIEKKKSVKDSIDSRAKAEGRNTFVKSNAYRMHIIEQLVHADKETRRRLTKKYEKGILAFFNAKGIRVFGYYHELNRLYPEWEIGECAYHMPKEGIKYTHKSSCKNNPYIGDIKPYEQLEVWRELDINKKAGTVGHIGTYSLISEKEMIGLLAITYDNKNIHVYEYSNNIKILLQHLAINMKKRDLTEKIQYLKKDKNHKEKELKNFVDLTVDFAHEFKTPLNIIMGGVKLIEKDIEQGNILYQEKSDLVRYMSMIRYNTYRLIQLIDNMIDKPTIEGNTTKLKLETVDIIALIEAICMENVGYIESKDLSFIFDTEVEELVLTCDKEKIERIITNLLSNAWKYSKPQGHISVVISIVDGYMLLTIEDDGIGMPEHMLKEVFKRYTKVEGNESREAKSSGLGLAIVKNLVHLHGGEIWIESERDKGTSVFVQLPLVQTNLHGA